MVQSRTARKPGTTLLAASTAVGLEVMAEMMDAEVTEVAGVKGRHDPDRTATRHGTEHGSVTLGGRRLPVTRPRVRTVGENAREVALASYETFADADLLTEQVTAKMPAGISTREVLDASGLDPPDTDAVVWGQPRLAVVTAGTRGFRRRCSRAAVP